MQYILTQNGETIITVGEKNIFNLTIKNNVYAIYLTTDKKGEHGFRAFVVGFYENKENAKYVLHLIFDAIANGESFEVPKESDLPDLQFLRTHGKMNSRKLSHGGS